jgi:hypothetical protein
MFQVRIYGAEYIMKYMSATGGTVQLQATTKFILLQEMAVLLFLMLVIQQVQLQLII